MPDEPTESQLPPISGDATPRRESPIEDFPQIEGYRILEGLGQGGMGAVYRALQFSTNREVALKLIGHGILHSEKTKIRFDREVELTARLEHPHIARVYESGLDRGNYYYAMELIRGLPLDEFVEKNRLTQRQILELMRTICLAVQHAHERGVIHRDLKPSNILVSADGQPHVLDFGLAKEYLEGDPALLLTDDGEVAGTPAYMSPEQAAGRHHQLNTRSDVYTLGVILFHLLTRQFPHDLSGGRDIVLRRIAEEDPRRARAIMTAVDNELDVLLFKALAHDPVRRYATAGALAEDISNYLNHRPLIAQPPTTLYYLGKWARRNRVPVAVGSAVIAVMLGVAVLSYARVAAERRRAVEAAEKEREARAEEQTARSEAERKAEENRRLLYVSQLKLAQQAWERNDARRMIELLESQAPKHGQIDLRTFEWHYLWRLCHRDLFAVRTLPYNCAAFSPDGKTLAVVETGLSSEGKLRLLSAQNGEELTTFHNPTKYIYYHALAFSPDGRTLAVATSGIFAGAILWDTVSTNEPRLVRGHRRSVVRSVAFSHDGKTFATAGDDGFVKLWDVASAQELRTLTVGGQVMCVSFSPRGATLATASNQGGTKIWDITSGSPVAVMEKAGRRVAYSPDGTILATPSADGVKLWEVATAQEGLTVKGHEFGLDCVAFSPDGKILATTGGDKTVILWDAGTGKQLTALRGFRGHINSLAISPDGRRLATANMIDDESGELKLWDVATVQGAFVFPHSNTISSVELSADGKTLATGSNPAYDRGDVRLFDIASGKEHARPTGRMANIRSLDLLPNRNTLAIATVEEGLTVKLFDFVTAKERDLLKESRFHVSAFTFSPDGKTLATTEPLRGGTIGVAFRDTATGEEIRTIEVDLREITHLGFSPDGGKLVTLGASGRGDAGLVKIWDVPTGRENFTAVCGTDDEWVSTHCGVQRSSQLAFSPDGKCFALVISTIVAKSSPPGVERVFSVKVYEAATFQEKVTVAGPSEGVTALTFSPGSDALAAAGHTKDGPVVKLWDIRTGQEKTTLREHDVRRCFTLAFSPDGNTLAIGTDAFRGKVRLWDTVTGQATISLDTPEGGVHWLAFSPDGNTLLAAGLETVLLWYAAKEDEVAAKSSRP